jgi:perosamine synthetase
VETRPFFIPIHLQPPYRVAESYPVSEMLAAQGINLPSAVDITAEEIDHVCLTFLEIAERGGVARTA